MAIFVPFPGHLVVPTARANAAFALQTGFSRAYEAEFAQESRSGQKAPPSHQ
jgi:hypothetical protein